MLLVISGVVNVTNREIRSVTQGADVDTSKHPTSYTVDIHAACCRPLFSFQKGRKTNV